MTDVPYLTSILTFDRNPWNPLIKRTCFIRTRNYCEKNLIKGLLIYLLISLQTEWFETAVVSGT